MNSPTFPFLPTSMAVDRRGWQASRRAHRRMGARRTVARALAVVIAALVAALSLTIGSAASAASPPRVYMYDPGATCWASATSPDFRVRTPVIFGIDYRTGYGNDSQWVRFKARVVHNTTGATYVPGSWSGWSVAYDNLSAAYSGEQTVSAPRIAWSGQLFRVVVDVEWWSGSQRL